MNESQGMSPHFCLRAAVAIVTLVVSGAALALVDSDGDGIVDQQDNCTLVANADQRDTNGDFYGNACDPDLNDDRVVNFTDLGLLKQVFFTTDPNADLDGNGRVNFTDLGIAKAMPVDLLPRDFLDIPAKAIWIGVAAVEAHCFIHPGPALGLQEQIGRAHV